MSTNLSSYKFYNKEWYIAADIVKWYNLSSNYNTYYSKCYSNGRLYGPETSFEFRLSDKYLDEFKALYGAENPSLNKSKAVWLIDNETVRKLLNKDIITTKEKTVKTVESNALSIKYNLGVDTTIKEFIPVPVNPLISNPTDNAKANDDKFVVLPTSEKVLLSGEGIKFESVGPTYISIPDMPKHIDNMNQQEKRTIDDLKRDLEFGKSSFTVPVDPSMKLDYKSTTTTYSKYSEEEISDAITLLSSKLTNTPYQQEKLLEGGSIRLDLFSCTRRSVYAIELKKGVITLDMIKEKLEAKHYLTSIINAYPDLNITFIFSSPMGISWEGFLYLQEASRSIGPHKIIYRPCSNLILDMINKKEKELPSYYYKQILDKPIIKYLLQVT